MANSTTDPIPEDDLEIQQEKAGPYPLPDGTISPVKSGLNTKPDGGDILSISPQNEVVKRFLETEGLKPASSSESTIPSPPRKRLSAESARKLQQQSELQIPSMTADALDDTAPDPLGKGRDEDSFYRKSTHTSPVLSSLPRIKMPKHTSNAQGVDSHLAAGKINSDSFYTSGPCGPIPAVEAIPAQDEVPEGVDTALFYSPRVARLLGGKTQGSKRGGLEHKGAKDTPLDHTNLAAKKDQDTFNVRFSQGERPTAPEDGDLREPTTFSEGEVKDLAQDVSKDKDASQVQVRTVARGSKL
jgi:aarF domain-containing kinase